MIILKTTIALRAYLEEQQQLSLKIGFIPTMGALHDGHLSLIEAAKAGSDVVVSSIFINPAQFNNTVDFEKYPVTIENDIALLETAGCDVLFLPQVKEMYPNDYDDQRRYDLGFLETVLEGKFRPGHFQGVCMIVDKLLDAVRPSSLFLGQKDYQQCMVIQRLVELRRNDPCSRDTKIVVCPTLREPDGLAMSSRNMRLNEAQRKKANAIFQSLLIADELVKKGSIRIAAINGYRFLEEKGFKVDYFDLADGTSLRSVSDLESIPERVAILVAAFLDDIRLIDNIVIDTRQSVN